MLKKKWYKKEWSSDIFYRMDGPWKHYAKWKNPDTEGVYCKITYIYEQCRIGISIPIESRLVDCLGIGEWGWQREDLISRGYRVSFLRWCKSFKIDCSGVPQQCQYVKCSVVHFKFVNFMLCQF